MKKRKLELELAATHKQLVLTSTAAVLPPPTPLNVDSTQLVNTTEIARPNVIPVVTKSVGIVSQAPFIPNMIPTSNVRTRIAPVNSALVSSMRTRDPRLVRQTTQGIPIAPNVPILSINEHFPSKLPSSK